MNDVAITFDDVLIEPKFSTLNSRKEVDLTTDLGQGVKLRLPVISANMESITEDKMALAMAANGGLGILHRFMPVDKNIELWNTVFMSMKNRYTDTGGQINAGVSIGITEGEKERAEALFENDAYIFCIDVAHGAQQAVVDQVKWLRGKYKDNIYIIVGNFATARTINDFTNRLSGNEQPNAFKVGIGPGSVCTTRIKTGVGVPQLSAIIDCVKTQKVIIADGGLKTPGDISKALGAGAKAVMIGGILAGTDESPGQFTQYGMTYKMYAGSASGGYGNGWKTSEGETMLVPEKGPVEPILKDIEGGLRSSFTYVGASNLLEFHKKVEFIKVSPTTQTENMAHYKRSKNE